MGKMKIKRFLKKHAKNPVKSRWFKQVTVKQLAHACLTPCRSLRSSPWWPATRRIHLGVSQLFVTAHENKSSMLANAGPAIRTFPGGQLKYKLIASTAALYDDTTSFTPHRFALSYLIPYQRGPRHLVVIVEENGPEKWSSNLGRGCLCFSLR